LTGTRTRIVDHEDYLLRRDLVQGKPVVRRGRKARDLLVTEDRPAAEETTSGRLEGVTS
jgi:hypothetical protein